MKQQTKTEIFRGLLIAWWITVVWMFFVPRFVIYMLLLSFVIITWITFITFKQIETERLGNGKEASEDRK